MNHEPTAKELAERISRKAVKNKKLKVLLNSRTGVKLANLEVSSLFLELQDLLPTLAKHETKAFGKARCQSKSRFMPNSSSQN